MIAEALKGKTILVTGTTGFLGKSIVEKTLRAVPEVGRINLAIRSSARRPAAERLEREVLSSPAFKRLKDELGEDAFARLAAEKLSVLEIDLGADGLGLTDAGRAELARCDIVIHSAAAVEFDNPADLSAQTNLLGAERMVTAVRDTGKRPHLVRSRVGPAGTPAMARATERLREKWVKDRLVERGRVHANAMGFSDIYSFTKAMAEHAVVELHGDVPLSIVRPSIIESSLDEPFPGWLEGFRMAEPIILAFGRGILQDFSGLPDSVLDIIPVDFVVNAVLAVAASPPPDAKPRFYHVASGSRNPLRYRRFPDIGREYFSEKPLRDKYGQAIGAPNWTYPTRSELSARARTALRFTEAAQWLVERLPLGAGASPLSDNLNAERERLERGLTLIQLYGVYTEVDCIFDTRNLMSVWDKLSSAEQKTFPFDPALYTWDHYMKDVHIPTVLRMSRQETAARRGKQPTGSTLVKASGDSVRSAIERRSGRSDVLAVFDVDGTLVETNVVEYFLWMRLRAQPLEDWPAFMAEMLREAPRWLYLERRSRAEFQRSFYRQYDGLDYEVMRRLGREALNAVTLRRVYPEGMRRIREHKRAGHHVLLLTGALDVVVEPLAELLEVEVDCAHLLEKDGRMTGDLQSPPPAGEARATLLEEYASRHGLVLSESFAYADSLSDLGMLELVSTPVVVNPDARLSQVAGQRGWRVERWRMAPGNWRPPMPDPRSPEYREAVRR